MSGGAGGLILVALLAYAAACAWWPMTRCGRCKDDGRLFSPTRKNWRPCPRCDGDGYQVRLGRQLVE